jgi:hypothetical protein
MKALLIAFFFISTVGFSQMQVSDSIKKEIANRPGITEEEFIKAKDLYLKMINSANYIEYQKQITSFVRQMNGVNVDFMNEAMWLISLKSQIKRTKFNSAKEGVDAWEKCVNASTIVVNENPEVHELMRRSTLEQIKAIMKPEMDKKREQFMARIKEAKEKQKE